MKTNNNENDSLKIRQAEEALASIDDTVTKYERTIIEKEVELQMIRENVRILFEGDYLPNPKAVIGALYPQMYMVHTRVDRILTHGADY